MKHAREDLARLALQTQAAATFGEYAGAAGAEDAAREAGDAAPRSDGRRDEEALEAREILSRCAAAAGPRRARPVPPQERTTDARVRRRARVFAHRARTVPGADVRDASAPRERDGGEGARGGRTRAELDGRTRRVRVCVSSRRGAGRYTSRSTHLATAQRRERTRALKRARHRRDEYSRVVRHHGGGGRGDSRRGPVRGTRTRRRRDGRDGRRPRDDPRRRRGDRGGGWEDAPRDSRSGRTGALGGRVSTSREAATEICDAQARRRARRRSTSWSTRWTRRRARRARPRRAPRRDVSARSSCAVRTPSRETSPPSRWTWSPRRRRRRRSDPPARGRRR